MRVLGISGSLRRGSFNTALLRHAGALFEAEGAEFEVYEGLRDLPAYDEDFDVRDVARPLPESERQYARRMPVLFATPEYNSSIPGFLKNAVDWLSRPSLAESALRGKPVAVVAGASAYSARFGRRPICARCSAQPAPEWSRLCWVGSLRCAAWQVVVDVVRVSRLRPPCCGGATR